MEQALKDRIVYLWQNSADDVWEFQYASEELSGEYERFIDLVLKTAGSPHRAVDLFNIEVVPETLEEALENTGGDDVSQEGSIYIPTTYVKITNKINGQNLDLPVSTDQSLVFTEDDVARIIYEIDEGKDVPSDR